MIVGIDLGTTHSLIGVYDEGEAKLFKNPLGQFLTPSVVGLMDDGSLIVGEIAKERLTTHPQLTTALFKRQMGTKKKSKLGKKSFSPEELSSFVLRALIDDAEQAMGKKVVEAVISVPAYFSDAQRKATKIAGELAGIKVERLINEPTAAALAYGLKDKGDKDSFLIIDLGGGTFDISVLEIFDDVIEVHATAGDNFLGGEDFTDVLLQGFCKENGVNAFDLSALESTRLSNQLEWAKKELSRSMEVEFAIELMGKSFTWLLNRELLLKLAAPLLQRMRAPIERAVRDAKLGAADVDEVVLVGGASRMQLVGDMVTKMFGRFPLRNIDPDQTIAIGAVIASGMKARNSSLEEVILTDVCPYTLGIETARIDEHTKQYTDGMFLPIISRNSTVPVSRMQSVSPLTADQGYIRIVVYQGESAAVEKNVRLGEMDVILPPASEENRMVDIRFTYDVNGILQVETTVQTTGETQEVFLKGESSTMSAAEVKKRFQELSMLKIHPRDQEENQIVLARAERVFEEYLDVRDYIQHELFRFKGVLESQDDAVIKPAREELARILADIEKRP